MGYRNLFNDLLLNVPDIHLGVGSGTYAEQNEKIIFIFLLLAMTLIKIQLRGEYWIARYSL